MGRAKGKYCLTRFRGHEGSRSEFAIFKCMILKIQVLIFDFRGLRLWGFWSYIFWGFPELCT